MSTLPTIGMSGRPFLPRVMTWKGGLVFLILLVTGCSRESTLSFCGRFNADATKYEEVYDFAKANKLLPDIPHMKNLEGREIKGQTTFKDDECGLAYFVDAGFTYKECYPTLESQINYRVGKYCKYMFRETAQ
jgi:hypothetical protein